MRSDHSRKIQAGCPNAGSYDRQRVWCGACYENLKGKANHRNHVGFRSPPALYTTWEKIILKRPSDKATPADGPDKLPAKEAFLSKFPNITEFLVATKYDDGGARETAALTITVSEGLVNVGLNDRDMNRSIYTADDSLLGALKLMEDAIVTGKAQWRSWKLGKKK